MNGNHANHHSKAEYIILHNVVFIREPLLVRFCNSVNNRNVRKDTFVSDNFEIHELFNSYLST